MMETGVNNRRQSLRGAFCLALCFLFPLTARAVDYELPRDIGSGPFSSCSLNAGTLYTCSGSVLLTSGPGDRITFTQSMTLRINGAFSMQNNSRILNTGHAVLISTTGSHDITLGNGNISSANFSAGGNFSAGNNASITGNVSAGGTLSIASNGTVSGFCFPTHPRCLGSNGCVASALGGDTLITCTRDGAVNIPAGVTSLRYLLVGGGGGGGGIPTGTQEGAGGGGGGAVRTGTILGAFPSATYYVMVGAGGAGGVGSSSAGATGGASSFANLVANGGSGGGSGNVNNGNGIWGINGGSGGGARYPGNPGSVSGTPPLGFAGGDDDNWSGGGGGGSAQVGSNAENNWAYCWGGDGGNGTNSNISGITINYGGGGGGGAYDGTVCAARGGTGLGGGGSASNTRSAGGSGTPNRGGGGAGATGSNSWNGSAAYAGGSGGSGIVILRFPTVSGPHHIRLLHDGEGLTCAPESITVRACANADCTTPYTADSVSVTLNPIANATWSANPVSTNPASGTAIVTLRKTDSTQAPNPVTLGVAAPYSGRCFIGASENCNMTFHDAGFVFDVPNHVAETSQAATIRAVKKSDSGITCVPAFANVSKPVTFTCTYANPASGTLPVRLSGTALNAGNSAAASCDASGQSLNLSFNASGAANLSIQYADVGNMTLNARHSDSGLVMTGSDSFIAAPASLAVSTSAPFVAGQAFTARITGRNASAQTTPNFGRETPAETATFNMVTTAPVSAANSELVGPAGGQPGIITAGAFTPAKCSPLASGSVCDNALAWSEVGDLSLSAILQSGNYLGSGLSAWGSGNAGPFRPAYLITELADAAGHATTSQPCGTFTYSGQPFRLRVTAMRPANPPAFGGGDAAAPTRNYTGAYARPVTLGRDEPSACAPLTTGFSHFTLAATSFTSGQAATPPASNVAAPLPIAFAQALAAPGPIPVCAKDTDGVNSHGQIQATLNIRNGRLWISNAYGSELLPLPIPLRAEYYDGTRWSLNTADNCTSLAVPVSGSGLDIHLTNSGTTTATLNNPLLAGNAGFRLSAPGTGRTGYVDITITAPDYLKAAGGGNPAARAAFGFRKTPLIYRRENF